MSDLWNVSRNRPRAPWTTHDSLADAMACVFHVARPGDEMVLVLPDGREYVIRQLVPADE